MPVADHTNSDSDRGADETGGTVGPGESWRSMALDRLDDGDFDVVIVGGGINGAVSAAALAGRGISVALVDGGDFAGFTSQESSNLIWGGFKYLENYELGLVRGLCESRNRLIDAYPENIASMGFLAALDNGAPYAPWFAALGAGAYWAIGGFETPRPRRLGSEAIEDLEPVIDTASVRGGIEYFDAYVKDNDSRFVFGFVRSAIDAGALAVNYVQVVAADHDGERWQLGLTDRDGGRSMTCSARVVINATGPFAPKFNELLGAAIGHDLVFSKGVHLIVPRIGTGERVLAFFDDTERLFYVIPMGRRSVIGTTDTRVDDPITEVTDADRDFLLDQINQRLNLERPLVADDVLATRCGVRPLVVPRGEKSEADEADWTALSRKHAVETDAPRSVVTVFGGKLTDCLNVGEEVAAEVAALGIDLDPALDDWYGEPPTEIRDEFMARARAVDLDSLRQEPDLEPLSTRLWRRYGRRAFEIVDAIAADPSLADRVMENADYIRAELHVAAGSELITKLDDFMRRRSKIAQVVTDDAIRQADGLAEVAKLLFGPDAQARLDEYLG